jgi:hypothetical protein
MLTYTLLTPTELRTLALATARRVRQSDLLQLPPLPF